MNDDVYISLSTWNAYVYTQVYKQMYATFTHFTRISLKFGLNQHIHYTDVMMGAMVAQITSLVVVYATVNSGVDQRKHQSYASLAFVWIPRTNYEFPAQMASNAENVSIWWRYHVRVKWEISDVELSNYIQFRGKAPAWGLQKYFYRKW